MTCFLGAGKCAVTQIRHLSGYKTTNPAGSIEQEVDSLFTTRKPVIFYFHAYPWLNHKLACRFKNHENFHMRGDKEHGNINRPLWSWLSEGRPTVLLW